MRRTLQTSGPFLRDPIVLARMTKAYAGLPTVFVKLNVLHLSEACDGDGAAGETKLRRL
jgi:hypothetical protein